MLNINGLIGKTIEWKPKTWGEFKDADVVGGFTHNGEFYIYLMIVDEKAELKSISLDNHTIKVKY